MNVTMGNQSMEFLVTELPGFMSREDGVLSAGDLVAGRVLGKINFGAISQAFAGTGNGVMSALARAASGCVAGDWKIRCTQAVTNLGMFEVVDPNGVCRGLARVGVTFTNGITFSIADGSTDFVLGDTFTVTVAAGSGQWAAVDLAATTGAQSAAGILASDSDASVAVKDIVVFVRGCEVNRNELGFGSLDAGQQTTAIAQLKALGILVREAI